MGAEMGTTQYPCSVYAHMRYTNLYTHIKLKYSKI